MAMLQSPTLPLGLLAVNGMANTSSREPTKLFIEPVPVSADYDKDQSMTALSEGSYTQQAAETGLYISSEDQAFWLSRYTHTLDTLMHRAGTYTDADRESHLGLLAEVVAPSMGPAPVGGVKPPCSPLLTSTGAPFEPSWNLADGGKSAIRFSFEPLGALGGTVADPYAQEIVPRLLPVLQRAVRSSGGAMDAQWFEKLMASLFLSDGEAAKARGHLPPGQRAPQSFVAFDLDGGRTAVKAYFFPILKHLASGKTCEEVTFDAIHGLSPDLSAAALLLEHFLATESRHHAPVEMLAIDCVDPAAGARVKVYARTESNAFDVVRDICTLGGRLAEEDDVRDGLALLEGIWHQLHNEDAPMSRSYSKAPKQVDTRHKGVCYGFELRPGCAAPEVKVYVPVWQYAESDAVIAANLASIFKDRGWEVHSRYADAIRDSFPRADFNASTGVHSYVSFAYSKKKGVYMTMYYAANP